MLAPLILAASVASVSLAAKCPNFPTVECREPNGCRKGEGDPILQALPISGFVVFEVAVPQFRRQRTNEIVVGLFGGIVPNATANFQQFASGGIAVGTGSKKEVYRYQGTPFHRIKKDAFMTGGDVMFKNGSGSISAYPIPGAWGAKPDNYDISNFGKGWIGMKDLGPDLGFYIGSQFFISLTNDRKDLAVLNAQPILHLGKVVQGFSLLERINEKAGKSWGSGKIPLDETLDPIFGVPLLRPKQDITISKSKFVSLEDGARKGYPKHAFNRPATGCLSGNWPKKDE